MPVDKYGWVIPVLKLYHEVEEIEIFYSKGYHASVEYCHLPNGKWVAASDLSCPMHGYTSACSVWNKQYETKEEAIISELNRIEKSLEDKDRKPFILQALQTKRNIFKQTEIEMAFEPTTNFEQVSLFQGV